MRQRIFTEEQGYHELESYLLEKEIRSLFLVCGRSVSRLGIYERLMDLGHRSGIRIEHFSEFSPNPAYESVVKGVEEFRRGEYDAIMAVGGGSAMDVAKCVKLYAGMIPGKNYLKQEIIANAIPLLAAPTTAGTGSEATRYAVIYYQGEKQSVSHESCIPEAVLFDPSVLETLPTYQKKAAMLDALCHAVESYWSVNSTEESRGYSETAVRGILENMAPYLRNDREGNVGMMEAANTAGKAINITQTTAGHAMCYKLTSLYGLAHGHAAALCVSELWPYMLDHVDKTTDPRGREYLLRVFRDLARTMGYANEWEAAEKFRAMLQELGIGAPGVKHEEEYGMLASSVNPIRLRNNPVELDEEAIEGMYRRMLRYDRDHRIGDRYEG